MKSRFFHGFLEKHNSNLAGHNFAFYNILLDDLAVLRSRCLSLSPKQVACREVHKFEFILNSLALSSLS